LTGRGGAALPPGPGATNNSGSGAESGGPPPPPPPGAVSTTTVAPPGGVRPAPPRALPVEDFYKHRAHLEERLQSFINSGKPLPSKSEENAMLYFLKLYCPNDVRLFDMLRRVQESSSSPQAPPPPPPPPPVPQSAPAPPPAPPGPPQTTAAAAAERLNPNEMEGVLRANPGLIQAALANPNLLYQFLGQQNQTTDSSESGVDEPGGVGIQFQ